MPQVYFGNSVFDKPVYLKIPTDQLQRHHEFWQLSYFPTGELLKILFALHESPYVDMGPDNYFSQYQYGETTVYRTNHDALHGLRKMLYAENYLNFLQQHGNTRISNAIEALVKEERACFLLFMFLERIGRTNELSSNKDSSIFGRTSAIFREVALPLGFKRELVAVFCEIYCNNHRATESLSEREGLTGSSETIKNKAVLFREIIALSHHTGLVRCRPRKNVASWLVDDLSKLIKSQYNAKFVTQIAAWSVEMAEFSLFETGTCYDPQSGDILRDNFPVKVDALLHRDKITEVLQSFSLLQKTARIDQECPSLFWKAPVAFSEKKRKESHDQLKLVQDATPPAREFIEVTLFKSGRSGELAVKFPSQEDRDLFINALG